MFVVVLEYEKVYLDNIPSAESYEQSYMHRDVISHVFVTTWEFVICAFLCGESEQEQEQWCNLAQAGLAYTPLKLN